MYQNPGRGSIKLKKLKYTLTIFFLLVFLYSNSQLKIENIKTDEDVINFVDEYGKKNKMEWKKIDFDIYNVVQKKTLSKKEITFFDSLTSIKWIKADFNNDQKVDLIFSGRLYSQLGILAFLTQGDSVVCNSVGSSVFGYYPTGISLINLEGTNLLTVSSFIRDNINSEFEQESFKSDTLIYKFGGLVEYTKSRKDDFLFDSIYFRVMSNWMGVVQVPLMKIYRNGLIRLYKNEHSWYKDSAIWVNGIYEFKIEKRQIEELGMLLEYINFLNLDSKYETKFVYDLSTATTVIYYNGKSKEVSDYGFHGTFGLNFLYRKFNEIKGRAMALAK